MRVCVLRRLVTFVVTHSFLLWVASTGGGFGLKFQAVSMVYTTRDDTTQRDTIQAWHLLQGLVVTDADKAAGGVILRS